MRKNACASSFSLSRNKNLDTLRRRLVLLYKRVLLTFLRPQRKLHLINSQNVHKKWRHFQRTVSWRRDQRIFVFVRFSWSVLQKVFIFRPIHTLGGERNTRLIYWINSVPTPSIKCALISPIRFGPVHFSLSAAITAARWIFTCYYI